MLFFYPFVILFLEDLRNLNYESPALELENLGKKVLSYHRRLHSLSAVCSEAMVTARRSGMLTWVKLYHRSMSQGADPTDERGTKSRMRGHTKNSKTKI